MSSSDDQTNNHVDVIILMSLMKVSVYCLEIVAATGITCSDEEKESLKVFFSSDDDDDDITPDTSQGMTTTMTIVMLMMMMMNNAGR